MKTIILLLLFVSSDLGQDKVIVERSYDVPSPSTFTLMVDNIYGDVQIESTSGDKISLTLEIEMWGRSDELIEKAKSELKLGERISEDSIVLFTKAPFIKRCRWGSGEGYNMAENPKYRFKYQYKLKVPKNTGVYAKTVNKGDIFIKNMEGVVKASNVNGEVSIENARDLRKASSVNGDVNISLIESPKEPVDFNTVNGDFNLELPDDFNAKIFFDSMNGDLYTAFDYQPLGPRVEKSKEHGTYRIGTKSGVEIGSGGPEFSFTSINGNVYLDKADAKN